MAEKKAALQKEPDGCIFMKNMNINMQHMQEKIKLYLNKIKNKMNNIQKYFFEYRSKREESGSTNSSICVIMSGRVRLRVLAGIRRRIA